ncbi:MAG: sigma-70 family RNA polymerase sigma factor, partial [Clostridiales bacterium]|nr:sigma-70 family RNA polymerase sigma factor [Clostridiales bacterium]
AYERDLKRMCCAYLRDRALAEDAVQETFLKAYSGMADFRGESSERTWLTRIAINTCRDLRRATWFKLVDPKATLERVPAQDNAPEADDTVLLAVMRLPAKSREVILLRHYQNLSLKEISEALDLGIPTVSSRLLRAREMLRKKLKGWYFDEE